MGAVIWYEAEAQLSIQTRFEVAVGAALSVCQTSQVVSIEQTAATPSDGGVI